MIASKIFKIYFETTVRYLRCTIKLNESLHLSSLTMCSDKIHSSLVSSVLMPPSSVYGMKALNRDAFIKVIEVPTVEVPVEEMKVSLKRLKPYLLKIPKLYPVQGTDKVKRILLNPELYDEKLKEIMRDVCWMKVTLSYENFDSESIFKAILPSETAGNVSGFSIIGHIIHLNLKSELLEYKCLIGEVLLDKNPNIKTVVNKVHIIESDYRNFQLELLAGEPNYEVIVKENGFQYAFDFSKVFWNPRLVHEHTEIVKKADAADLVFDVFAGVGPFAIPLAKKKCIVHANDLNPHSYHWLCHNAKLNKVSDYLTAYNLDGRKFIQTIVKENIVKNLNEGNKNTLHILMNLPACALEFVDAFQGLLKDFEFQNVCTPIVYCYFFLKKDEEVSKIINKYFDEEFSKTVEVTSVRLVAPNKRMMRLTYKIPISVLFESKDFCNEPLAKRIKK